MEHRLDLCFCFGFSFLLQDSWDFFLNSHPSHKPTRILSESTWIPIKCIFRAACVFKSMYLISLSCAFVKLLWRKRELKHQHERALAQIIPTSYPDGKLPGRVTCDPAPEFPQEQQSKVLETEVVFYCSSKHCNRFISVQQRRQLAVAMGECLAKHPNRVWRHCSHGNMLLSLIVF